MTVRNITSKVRHRYRRHIPYTVRRRICQGKQWLIDRHQGTHFAQATSPPTKSIEVFSLKQRIMPSATYANKVHNLTLASASIEKVVVEPEETLSFGHCVGNPTTARGYKNSRALINGVLEQTEGGGLCQLSGLLYQVALHTGLNVQERHNHSVDIYTEEARFTPLGSDATVVYGFKDLRIQNNTPRPIWFSFQFEEGSIAITLHSTQSLPTYPIEYTKISDNPRTVHTMRFGQRIATSTYKVL